MAEGVPTFLKSGERARLIPIVADSSREQRVASVLLASLPAIPDFAHALLASVGQRVGRRTRLSAFTEVVPREVPNGIKERPDGLLTLSTGKRSWSAFLEVKIGNKELVDEQVERYLALAKANGIDALITISNQFTARPDHHPVRVPKKLTRKVELYHWPWMWVYTQASLLQLDEAVEDPEQAYLLDELVRFLAHDSTGIDGFDRMNKEWKDVVKAVQSGAALRKTAQEIENTVASWHEEERDICLIMSRHLGRPVRLKLQRKHRGAPIERLKDDCAQLAEQKILHCVLEVPDAAADLHVTADLQTRTLICAMRVDAPKDKKSTKARVNWLLRQIAKADDPDLFVKAAWPSKAPDTMETLARARDDPDVLQTDNRKLAPHALEVLLIRDVAGKFSGTRTFIEHLEEAVPRFYDQVGQHLRAWQPPPPKPRKKQPETAQDTVAGPVTESEAAAENL